MQTRMPKPIPKINKAATILCFLCCGLYTTPLWFRPHQSYL